MTPPDPDSADVLTEDAPPVEPRQAVAILATHYGLDAQVEALPSERDHNFRVRVDGAPDRVLKITHPAEPRSVTNLQTAALRHIAAVDPGLAVPVVIPTRDGTLEPELSLGGHPLRVVRLLSFLPGTLLAEAPRSDRQDDALGAFLARLGRSLRGFFHPAAGGADLLWDVRQIPRARTLAAEIETTHRRDLVERVFDAFEADILAILPSFRAQIVHNDLNPSNVVVDRSNPDSIAGVLDFGDMMHGPLVCDLAIGAAYRWTHGEHPLAGPARFARGYDRVTRLEEEEIACLVDLVRARVALTVTIANWQGKAFPAKRAYVLRLHEEMWTFLERLAVIPRDEARLYLLHALGRE